MLYISNYDFDIYILKDKSWDDWDPRMDKNVDVNDNDDEDDEKSKKKKSKKKSKKKKNGDDEDEEPDFNVSVVLCFYIVLIEV